MDHGRKAQLNRLKVENEIRREKLRGVIYCAKCKDKMTHRVAMKGLNKTFCPVCYLILSMIEDKYVKGTLVK